ncbi:MAG: pyridoxal phosphate-dependent aminotransferase [Candidatus Cloacimonetes bacterium]|nr:pyridoxal phosphate-dependent aminotransferase [Candidatus Cloacimonadota bacterium]MCF7813048.1 pyridoxal phosphate-dependent aminotransferase [Candidatus Cloacimonadota bacterium]MCF7867211.1 pyridoxal phosphate-dependent aminotransferase [Candidatus Cloacimonadota bacterium]MCF7882655.1 pyridoxal phosphate-dependent aminotransferase [Candidatus Cloacimonadota bacterium]
MKIQISHRAKAIRPSPTLTVSALAKQMKAEGIEVINFGVGEPDFNTPDYIKKEAHVALHQNFTRYTDTSGIPELRKAISEKLKRDNNLDCDPTDILVSPGAKASIVFVLMTICDPRDEVLIPSPYWVSYTAQVEMVDAFPILLPTTMAKNFKINAKQLEETILTLSSPKALILNSPNNPTGTVYTMKELEEIAEVCLKHEIVIISDEIYEKLIYDGLEHVSIATISPEVREQTILINGLSKAYAMTGWRLGYAAGPKEVIRRASRIQSHTTSCVNSMTQRAAVAALRNGDDSIIKMRDQFEKRRNFLVAELNNIPNIKCRMPQGAFYAMPNIQYYLQNNRQGIKDTVDFCEYMLKENRVAIVPGSAFGANKLVRFSYANSMENIEEGLKRFRNGLDEMLYRK